MLKLITPHLQHDQPLDPQRADDHAEFHFDNYANTFARLIGKPAPRFAHKDIYLILHTPAQQRAFLFCCGID
ncbi:MAG: hypothetical protein HYY33_08800, partial [Chloroflexi bacterium]|nr:hypothetical protein [Chloroflexota bacterium]